jgi:diguanylate cyclase (GGDEF)-like protein
VSKAAERFTDAGIESVADRVHQRVREPGARARNRRSCTCTYLDVVGLKTLNDTEGHGAGDALLKWVVVLIREHLRPFDLVIRLGGDEFLCAMSNMAIVEARRRFSAISAALAAVRSTKRPAFPR